MTIDAIQILKDMSLLDMECKLETLEEQKREAVEQIDNEISALKILIKAKQVSENGKEKKPRKKKDKVESVDSPVVADSRQKQADQIHSFLMANGPSNTLSITRATGIHHHRVASLLNDKTRFKQLASSEWTAK